MSKALKTTLIRSDRKLGMWIFAVVAGVAAFCALYLTFVSSLPFNAAYYAALPIGFVVSAAMLVFYENKYARYGIIGVAALFTVLAVSAGIGTFANGMFGFFNAAVERINAARHAGYASFAADGGFGSDFLFMSVVAVWLAVFASIVGRHPHIFITVVGVYLFANICLGLYPQYYTVVLLVLVFVCSLAVYNGLTLKAILCYLLCALAVSVVTAPCYFFDGTANIERFGKKVSIAVGDMIYGSSLPSGRLAESGGMRGSDKVRLKLTVSPLTPTLYLRGFVGSELDGTEWSATDKNLYVQNGNQGLLEYVGSAGVPTTQYSAYSALLSNNNKYELTVENVSADRRYVYAPYTLSEYSAGSAYYDMGLHGGVFESRTYTHTIFASDASSERVTQANWVTQDVDRTVAMDEYIRLEGQYRAFVYETYLGLDEKTEETVKTLIGDFETRSINTATQYIRAYFLDAFMYSDECDGINSDFASEFFGGEVKRANAAYFASAATCMFRALGFAARYAEGYYVNIADDNEPHETLSVDVLGSDTHAWTEVYFDGMGWLPIEVTPTFFSEQPPDTSIDPENPSDNDGETSPPDVDPDRPSDDDPDKPDVPITPNPPPEEKVETSRLAIALKVLVPIASVVLALALAVLALVVRRRIVASRRRKRLDAEGVEFGNAAYEIVARDCKRFGGFDAATLEKYGVSTTGTERFTRIVERCVYGGYSPSDAERTFVVEYITGVQSAIVGGMGFFRAMYCRYILCMTI